MRHSCIFAAVSMTTLVLSGCGLEDTGPSAFNPATNVDLTFSSFNLENTEVAPDNLGNTRFWDFYRGIQPAADDSDDLQTTGEIRSHIEVFIRATPTDAGTSYDSVRNPLDLMNQVLASGEVTNFQEGKRYISQGGKELLLTDSQKVYFDDIYAQLRPRYGIVDEAEFRRRGLKALSAPQLQLIADIEEAIAGIRAKVEAEFAFGSCPVIFEIKSCKPAELNSLFNIFLYVLAQQAMAGNVRKRGVPQCEVQIGAAFNIGPYPVDE
mgnify:CR=1 FL=1